MLYQILLNPGENFLSGDINDITTLLFKIMLLIGAFLYVLFSVVVVRQITIMRATLITSFSPVLQLVGYIHLALSITLLIAYILILN